MTRAERARECAAELIKIHKREGRAYTSVFRYRIEDYGGGRDEHLYATSYELLADPEVHGDPSLRLTVSDADTVDTVTARLGA